MTDYTPIDHQLHTRYAQYYLDYYDLRPEEIVAWLHGDHVRIQPRRYAKYWHVLRGNAVTVAEQFTALRNRHVAYSRATGWALRYDVRRARLDPYTYFVALWWVPVPDPEWHGPLQDVGVAWLVELRALEEKQRRAEAQFVEAALAQEIREHLCQEDDRDALRALLV